jgi:D-alanyl-D-alanine carboxypeptidase (penicillin-binding protein 5/6)
VFTGVGFNALKIEQVEASMTSAKGMCVLEQNSKRVLYNKDMDKHLANASTTKIVTAITVIQNRDNLDEVITVHNKSIGVEGTSIYLRKEEQMSVRDLLYGLMLRSGNDSAVALAYHVGGTLDNFVTLMNKLCITVGANNTNFANPHGLDEENHYTTCYDMAIVACDLLRKYEDIVIPFSSMYESYVRCDTDNPFWLVNTNKMLKLDNGIDGLKTGWTNEAGYCITTTMKKNGMRLVAVVMGAETPTLRNQDVLKLLEYGFNKYEVVLLKDKGEEILCESDLLLTPNKYKIITSEKITFIKYKNQVYDKVDYEVILYRDKIRNLEYKNIGLIKTYIDGKLINETSLDLKEVHQKSNFFDVFVNIFSSLF